MFAGVVSLNIASYKFDNDLFKPCRKASISLELIERLFVWVAGFAVISKTPMLQTLLTLAWSKLFMITANFMHLLVF